ncbi:hypothetical protein [Nostoc sp.]|uniref:hypothetical protein n=1 Tax=Nostoc sp. TaxID=1180 RepID=UPI002FFABCE1
MNLEFTTPNSQLPTPNSQLPTPNSQLPTPNSPKERYYSVCQLRVMVCKDSDRY